jgi:hypothetical protein
MNTDILRCSDADTDLIAFDAQDGHGDIVTDHQGFSNATGKD